VTLIGPTPAELLKIFVFLYSILNPDAAGRVVVVGRDGSESAKIGSLVQAY